MSHEPPLLPAPPSFRKFATAEFDNSATAIPITVGVSRAPEPRITEPVSVFPTTPPASLTTCCLTAFSGTVKYITASPSVDGKP